MCARTLRGIVINFCTYLHITRRYTYSVCVSLRTKTTCNVNELSQGHVDGLFKVIIASCILPHPKNKPFSVYLHEIYIKGASLLSLHRELNCVFVPLIYSSRQTHMVAYMGEFTCYFVLYVRAVYINQNHITTNK